MSVIRAVQMIGVKLLTATVAAALCAGSARAADPRDWSAVLREAKGRTVWFHAWGGEARVNDYIAWAAAEVERLHGVTVKHVKLTDTSEAVGRVLAEKTAGQTEGGAVDLVWINGQNFAAMKKAKLLFGPWSEALPNFRFVDASQPTVTHDFTVPVEGLEAPWGAAQIVFYHDGARLKSPPRSLPALLDWAKATPGRFTYPQPPDFLGLTFLKQALYALVPDPKILQRPAGDDFEKAVAPLFSWLDALHPVLWRQGRAFPQNSAALRTLMADGEIDLALSFNPAEAASAIASGELPETVRSYMLDGGTIGNVNFVAIPFNANAKAGAMVFADFLLSPRAQARKQDPTYWGSGTVLALDRLTPEDRALFENLSQTPGLLALDEYAPQLPEPHASWMDRLREEWTRRYAVR